MLQGNPEEHTIYDFAEFVRNAVGVLITVISICLKFKNSIDYYGK